LAVVLFFNVFPATSTQTVWIVMGVGAIFGLALGMLLIKMTRAFFMIVGGYMGYLVGIFLYDVFLQYIHADPKVIYWVTIVGCIVICSMLALWLVKHVLIIATSICGAYAVIRGASLYIGHFPNESVIIDLIEHKEFEQLQNVSILMKKLFLYFKFLVP
jgi:mannose/fructose/N-acetylgalactosamine-specific phosphotransferase system component IID